jgi:hypothetical protein
MKMTLGFGQLAGTDLIQPLQGWTHRQLTQGRPWWANPGLNDFNPFGVIENAASVWTGFATLKGWLSLSPGLERSDYPGFAATQTNPVRVESSTGGNP